MRNQFLLLITMMIIGSSSFGQFRLGINTSYSKVFGEMQSVSLVDSKGYEVYDLNYLGQDNFYSIGLSGYAEKGNLYFMPSVNFRSTSHSFQIMNYGESGAEVDMSDIETQSLHIPITAGLKYDKFRLGVGPDFNFILDSEEDLASNNGVLHNARSINTGFHFEIGYDPIPNIKLSANYEFAFYNITDDYKFGGKQLPLNTTPKMLNFSIALFL